MWYPEEWAMEEKEGEVHHLLQVLPVVLLQQEPSIRQVVRRAAVLEISFKLHGLAIPTTTTTRTPLGRRRRRPTLTRRRI